MSVVDDPYNIRAELIGRALEEEMSNCTTRAWAALFLVMAGGCLGFGILMMAFSALIHPLPFLESVWLERALILPSSVLGALGLMGWIVSSNNSIMELRPYERAQIDKHASVWENLPSLGRVLLVIFGSALGLAVVVFVLRVSYKIIFL